MVAFNSIELNCIVFDLIEKNAFGWGLRVRIAAAVSGGRDRLRLLWSVVGADDRRELARGSRLASVGRDDLGGG